MSAGGKTKNEKAKEKGDEDLAGRRAGQMEQWK